MEWAISIMADAMHGANLVHDIGYLGQGLIGHPAGLVMCDEIISYVKRFVRGFELSDSHIGLDVIREVGPGGDFLTTEQTMQKFKTEHWLPTQCNRDNLDSWLKKGGKDWAQTCTEKAREILQFHTPAPLGDAAAAALSEIRREAEAKLKGHEFRS